MTSELSIFAARLRAFIEISMDELGVLDSADSRALAQHADAEFNGMALVSFALQFGRNEPYRRLCEARGVTPSQLTHWSETPAVPTSAFKESEFTCLPAAERTHVFHSSGTTRQRPSRHFHSAESLALYEASLWPWFKENVGPKMNNQRLLCLTPSAAQVRHSSLIHMFDVVRQHSGADENVFVGRVGAASAWTLDFDSACVALRANDESPVLVLGTAFSFVQLLDKMRAHNFRVQLPEGSRVMETGGYKGRSRELPKAELHELIAAQLGVPLSQVICEYGMSELSSQAYDRVPSFKFQVPGSAQAFRFPPWARAKVISPETGREVAEGETGLLRVFDLANVFSVMAIQTEDLAVRRGAGFELIGRAPVAESRGCSLMSAENS